MKKITGIILITVIAALVSMSCSSISNIGSVNYNLESLKGKTNVKECCYEVVIKKPDEKNDKSTYDKELPWDLVDINYRNDDYLSIGTAFAVSENSLLTAGHVLDLYTNSKIYDKRYIRETRVDAEGNKTENVYEVDEILTVNNHKDYVEFTVKDKVFDKWLTLTTKQQFNTTIYTAGNALGEGVVIRDGILLDKIPESTNGEWFYLKSSIMTNPGNSGGPLLNPEGEVIGIVISKKDDFCYSLPISEITDGEGYYYFKMRFGFAAFNELYRNDFEYNLADIDDISLPVSYQEYMAFHHKKSLEHNLGSMESLFEENKDEIFPNGESSVYALHASSSKTFPQVLLKDSDVQRWFYTKLEPYVERLNKNGIVRYQQIYEDSSYWLIEITQPDDMEAFALYNNPEMLMDYFLKGIKFTRNLFNGDSGTRITSLGAPIESYELDDNYGRNWKINVWMQEYYDRTTLFAVTPTPKGLAAVYLFCSSSALEDYRWDFEQMLNFVELNYYGKIVEWDSFLERKDLIPEYFSGLDVEYIENQDVRISSPEMELYFDNEDFRIKDDNQLKIYYDFFKQNNEVVYDIRKLAYIENMTDNYFLTYRYLAPDESLADDFQIEWNEIVNGQHPFTRHPYIDNNGNTKIGTVHSDSMQSFKSGNQDELFSIIFSREEKVDDELFLERLDNIEGNFILK